MLYSFSWNSNVPPGLNLVWPNLTSFHAGLYSVHGGIFTFQLHIKKQPSLSFKETVSVLCAAFAHFSHAAAEGSGDNNCISESPEQKRRICPKYVTVLRDFLWLAVSQRTIQTLPAASFSSHTYVSSFCSLSPRISCTSCCLVASCVFTLWAPPAHCDESLNGLPNFRVCDICVYCRRLLMSETQFLYKLCQSQGDRNGNSAER